MSELFTYICTKSTVDPYVSFNALNLNALSREVSDAFLSLQGGYSRVGQLAFFPVQRSVPNHLLCDGREVYKDAFPELWEYLGSSQGTPTDPDKFVVPSFVGAAAFAPAATSSTETENQGTVSTPTPTPPPGDPAPNPDLYGDTTSGGRVTRGTAIP
jgi:hypothetical protein